ncbi:alpha-ketoglutarate decarboxylase [Lutibacter sp. TH_r2]|uniref:alpha-ketoglutarate decarboxylase n=1 Tax=Lutibacter sp. TH_r2 TaxID=3082083 RepID=UPI002953EF51|nr:alpha-ketoglutarate decarboxylase [Lutibacter sp. TH_r2]MDV7186186.1 alpha-ketoglutarate decarboxylase [Lutibacter sp. TH_r2]
MMSRNNLILVLFLISSFISYAQSSSNYLNSSKKVRFGGTFNMGFGSNYSTLSISPSAIYDFSQNFSAGASLTYVYVKNKSTIQKSTNILGGSLMTFYRPFSSFQLSLEYEQLHLKQNYSNATGVSQWQPALYFGAEYITGRVAMGLRYDILFDENKNAIYSSALSPVFRIYF